MRQKRRTVIAEKYSNLRVGRTKILEGAETQAVEEKQEVTSCLILDLFSRN